MVFACTVHLLYKNLRMQTVDGSYNERFLCKNDWILPKTRKDLVFLRQFFGGDPISTPRALDPNQYYAFFERQWFAHPSMVLIIPA